jgi:hypothetical protein
LFNSKNAIVDPQVNSPPTEPTNESSEPVTGLGLSVPPTRNFSIQDANTTTPEDVLMEVEYGGFGGPGPCDNYVGGLSIAEATPTTADWLEPISIYLCGIQTGNNIDATLQTPDGKTIKDPNLIYGYSPSIDSQIGEYRFTFSDGNATVQFDVIVSMPNEPRMFYIENNKVYYLYGLSPNERIRFFQYTTGAMKATFVGWQEYNADKDGQLMIKPSQEDGFYIPVGDQSGEIPFFPLPDGRVWTLGILKNK